MKKNDALSDSDRALVEAASGLSRRSKSALMEFIQTLPRGAGARERAAEREMDTLFRLVEPEKGEREALEARAKADRADMLAGRKRKSAI